jgi:hypothetical protein
MAISWKYPKIRPPAPVFPHWIPHLFMEFPEEFAQTLQVHGWIHRGKPADLIGTGKLLGDNRWHPLDFEILATGPVGSWPSFCWIKVGQAKLQRSQESTFGYLQITNLSAGKWKVPIHAVPCRQDRLDGCSPVHFWWSWVVPQSHPKCLSSKALKNGWFFLLNINCAINDPLVPKWTAHLFIPFCSLARALPCTKRRSLFQQPG